MLMAMLLMATAVAGPAPASDTAETALRKAENGWSQAFVTGDGAFLDTLLDPAYVSVGTGGAAHDKAAIIAMAKGYAAAHPGSRAEPMPPTSTIDVKGASAIVRHTSARDVSVDVFYFQDGHWRAWYSQHTAVKPAA
jgi:Domain of unknown function (DUF4440)